MFTSGWQPFLHTRNPRATLQTRRSWFPTSGILTAAFRFEVWLIWREVWTLLIKNKTSQVLSVLLGLPLYLNIVLTCTVLCFMPLDTIYLFKGVNLLKGWWQTRGTSPRPRHCHCFQHLISFVSFSQAGMTAHTTTPALERQSRRIAPSSKLTQEPSTKATLKHTKKAKSSQSSHSFSTWLHFSSWILWKYVQLRITWAL